MLYQEYVREAIYPPVLLVRLIDDVDPLTERSQKGYIKSFAQVF